MVRKQELSERFFGCFGHVRVVKTLTESTLLPTEPCVHCPVGGDDDMKLVCFVCSLSHDHLTAD